jgi:hypothetical protein
MALSSSMRDTRDIWFCKESPFITVSGSSTAQPSDKQFPFLLRAYAFWGGSLAQAKYRGSEHVLNRKVRAAAHLSLIEGDAFSALS